VARIEINGVQRGTSVPVHVGDQVVLRLPENASAGYTWSLDAPPEGMQLIEDRYERPGDAAPGARSMRTFELLVAAPGRHRLRLVNARPWEGTAGAVETFEVEIAASDG
jgi:inhibitor of cysteine peptidase